MSDAPKVRLHDLVIVSTAMSLGPCSPRHILDEMAIPATPENEFKVIEALEAHRFDRHGAFWAH